MTVSFVAMRARLPAGLVTAFIAAAVACAPPQPAGSTPPADTAPAASLEPLLSDAVLVLPVHQTTADAEVDPAVRLTAAGVRVQFDSALQRALAPHVTGTWSWPPELRALHRRNPLHLPDPAQLSTGGLRGRRLAAGQILPADLGSDIRALLSVAGSRRYVLLPLDLRYAAADTGTTTATIHLVLIDARRAMISEVVPVSATAPSDDVLAALALAIRLQFTGSDSR